MARPLRARSRASGLDVVAINLPQRLARLSNGIVVPITNLYDGDGNATEDIGEAVQFVCGSDTLQAWFNGPVAAFGERHLGPACGARSSPRLR